MTVYQATASAPVNIASTLDQDHLRSTTTSRADPSFTSDQLWLNGKEDSITAGSRLETCIREMKSLRKSVIEDKDSVAPKLSEWHVRIASYNNFPTAAGLASSASGFAALVASLAELYGLVAPLVSPSTLSLIARQGSGSACRSLYGGYVAWEMGSKEDGSDSLAVQTAPESHWPEMHALICVVNDAKKGTSSTSGMQRTVQTSDLLQYRIKETVPRRMAQMEKAIKEKDFDTFARVTMADSNSFHAVALDTEPPIFYMNDVSRAIISIVVELNRVSLEEGKGYRAAYTYDAGPNAVIYALDKDIKEIIQLILAFFPQPAGDFKDRLNAFGGDVKDVNQFAKIPQGFNEAVAVKREVGAVKGLIHTKVGGGPRRLDDSEGLLDASGLPKTLA
ncbi:diphosphomevalonate decarboxylase [Coprinopsis sp. MPI-PUGE-AT-0042]|nr:diphosphomevalonate decarboxylase [Coprinopsis sp. MPI-PUGE-AT-0042]